MTYAAEGRWGTDAERGEAVWLRSADLVPQLEMRRDAAKALPAGPMDIPPAQGFLSCDRIKLPEVSAVVTFARQARADLDSFTLTRLKRRANKPFMMKLIEHGAVGLDSPLMRLALHPAIVGPVTRYLGMVPILQFVNVYFSSHAGDELQTSQLYHCDSDDATQVKVWVLCSTVTPESGPLTLIPAEYSEYVRDCIGYTFDRHLTDEDMLDVLGGRGLTLPFQFVGKAGTVGFFDTSRCFHFGSRFTSGKPTRLIAMLQYLTPLNFLMPADYWNHARYRHLGTAPGLSDVARMVLGSV